MLSEESKKLDEELDEAIQELSLTGGKKKVAQMAREKRKKKTEEWLDKKRKGNAKERSAEVQRRQQAIKVKESVGPNLNKELANIMNGGEISPRAKTYADYARESLPEAIQEDKSTYKPYKSFRSKPSRDDLFLRPKTKEYRRWKTDEEKYDSQSSFRQPTSKKLKRREVRRQADKRWER